jgi:alkanesulfonate monooxygenase SsuD/methylene tetrahydromethanopterin reductase-like flavin-dependent oxidoreductase (luciferase family)
VKISLFYEFPLPRPWSDDDEHILFQDGLDEVEAADQAGFSTVWLTEHHFLEEYCHSTAPEIFLAAASQRTKDIRLGFGIMHLPPAVNHPARVAERVSTLDLLSNGRVEFGTGESSSVGELGGFNIDPADKRTMWEEALEVSIRCMTEEPFTGFKGQHIEMPPRNVVPKPLQKPHPPVWVACTRPASVQMAAQRGLGALSFAYTGPGPLTERVNGYYKEFEENGAPVTPQMNPNILAIGGDLSMMVAATDEQAVERLGLGGGFFAFGIMHYYMTGMHTPGRTGVWQRHLEEIEKDPSVAYGPGRGPIGSPATVREFLRGYEESGVDELILLLTPRSHEATMESIELMGREVLPEFIERDEKAVAEKAKRMEPIIEKVEARRPTSTAPTFDESYSFGGLPTGRQNYTANEVSLAMDEMNAGIEQAAQKLKSGEGWTSRNPATDQMGNS